MKKTLMAFMLLSATLIASAQDTPTSFPRKFLIEHFTGDGCGYCPGGMYSMLEYLNSTSTTHIWVSHHYGYNDDEYTIPASKTIGSLCGVQGAPNMALNRTKLVGTTIGFHPGYIMQEGMAEIIADKCETTAEASVVINHTYNADTRELNLTVSGQVANPETKEYQLTVLIKENGLIGKQADYTYSWKGAGYKEFVHPCVARGLLTAAKGDEVAVENQTYSATFTYQLPLNWVAENCCVVAYITPRSGKPIINAEETPLVAGTTGGAEYLPFAITENKEPNNVTKLSFTKAELSKPADDKLTIQLIADGSTRSDNYGPMTMVANLEFNTTGNQIPTDSINFVSGNELNTFSAGYADLATQSFGGSYLAYFTSISITEDDWQLCHLWRIMSGSFVTKTDGTIAIKGKLCNGKNFSITLTLPEDTAVEDIVFDKATIEKLMRDGQVIIRIDDMEYDLQGRIR